MDPFAEFDKVQAESKPLKKRIGDRDFEFPGACPADVALELLSLVRSNPGVDPASIAITQMPKLLSEEELSELLKRVTWPSFEAIVGGLFTHYGLLSKEPQRPNRKARRASKTGSSESSARSEPTSDASTDSSSPETSTTSPGVNSSIS